MLDFARNALVKKVLQENATVKRFGTVHALSVDTAERTLSLDFGLVGEPSPVHFSARYELLPTEGGAEVRLFEIHCGKPWIEEVLKIVSESRGGEVRIPLGGLAAKVLAAFF